MAKTLCPYIHFNDGKAQEALDFYHGVFGGKLDISRYGDLPQAPVEDKYKQQIMHASLKTDEFELMISDTGPMGGVVVGGNISVSLFGQTGDKSQLSEYFSGLSEGGKVGQALELAPWGDVFGMVTDKFGITWMVNISDAS